MKDSTVCVAIDGPAGAGKSTLSRRLAETLGYIYVDTGALYRTVGLFCLRAGLTPETLPADLGELLKQIRVDLTYTDDGAQAVLLNGEDVSALIRTPEASLMASAVSAKPEVRAFLLHLQQDMAVRYNVVMDGRDIGTVVLPHADVKIFLTASPAARADRRYAELTQKGMTVNYDDVLADIVKRDYNDSHRAVAPLKQADDALLLDTTELDLRESLTELIRLVKERLS